ncbi:MAG: universal stress protein [Acidimicrobiia bacterium]|nr:universal stress protein [Acidimicrobiia bacterium]
MKRFQSIVVIPVTMGPEAPKALYEAVSLARSSGATVEVLALRPAPSPLTLSAASEAGMHELVDILEQALDHQIETWTESVGHLGVPVGRCDSAHPDDVAAVVASAGVDLVVMGPGQRTGDLGRVTEELLVEAPVSVLVAKLPS